MVSSVTIVLASPFYSLPRMYNLNGKVDPFWDCRKTKIMLAKEKGVKSAGWITKL